MVAQDQALGATLSDHPVMDRARVHRRAEMAGGAIGEVLGRVTRWWIETTALTIDLRPNITFDKPMGDPDRGFRAAPIDSDAV